MSRLRSAVSALLRRRGYALAPLAGGQPATLDSFLAGLRLGSGAPARIHLFANDPACLNSVHRHCPPGQIAAALASAPSVPDKAPDSPQVVLADFDDLLEPIAPQLARLLPTATVLLAGLRLARFWHAGDFDWLTAAARFEALGLPLHDILRPPAVDPLLAPGEPVWLVGLRPGVKLPGSDQDHPARALRLAEAQRQLTAPLVTATRFVRLTGRGDHGYAAGICNPGALGEGDGVALLARGELAPWPAQRASLETFLGSCRPVLLRYSSDLRLESVREVSLPAGAGGPLTRCEDFRLFAHDGETYSNHTVITADPRRDARPPVRPERMATRIALSRLDAAAPALTLLGTPRLNRPCGPVEKNWAFFATGHGVHFIYSFNPFRLFTARDFPGLDFELARECRIRLADDSSPEGFRNSTNPVAYDRDHLLHLVHRVFPGKRYVFWAVLLHRETLQPVRISRRPLLRAPASAGVSILYACSVIPQADGFLIFGGLDDCGLGAWRLSRSELDANWEPLRIEPAQPGSPPPSR